MPPTRYCSLAGKIDIFCGAIGNAGETWTIRFIRVTSWAVMTLTKPTFPAPDHDHDRCTADGIQHAERVCVARAQKFTPIRRQVLEALLSSHRPLGAYEVIDELAKSMP